MSRTVSFHHQVLTRSLLVVLSTVVLIGGAWMLSDYWRGQAYIAEVRAASLARSQEQIRDEVFRARRLVDLARQRADAGLRDQLRAHVDRAHAIASTMYEQLSARYAPSDLQSYIIEALRGIRFFDGRGYYFITTLAGVSRLWPTMPEREGQCVLDCCDSTGQPLVRDQIAIARESGAGFYQYTMVKPQAPGDGHEKLSYIRHFAPFDWYIGCGEYRQDHLQEVQDRVLEQLAELGPQRLAYYFASTWEGDVLLGPARGSNIFEGTNLPAQEVVRQLIDTARAGGGFVRYQMPAIDDQQPEPKLSYVLAIPEWGWYLGAGTSLGPIADQADAMAAVMSARIRRRASLVGVSLLLVLGAMWWFARRSTRLLMTDIDTVRTFLAGVPEGTARLDGESLRFREFADIAKGGEAMLAALQQSEGSLRELIEHAPLAILVARVDGVIEMVNPRAQELIGASAAAAGAGLTSCWEVLLPDPVARQGFQEQLDQALATAASGTDACVAIRSCDVQGRARDLDIALAVAGERRILVVQDLSEHFAATRALEERTHELSAARAQLLAAIEHSPAGIVIAEGSAMQVRIQNPVAGEILGQNMVEQGTDAFTLYTPEGAVVPQAEWPLRRAIAGAITCGREVLVKRADGSQRRLLINAAPIGDGAGMAVFDDITERRALEDQLRQSQKLDSIGQLAGGVAHDFNNQLAGIQGFAELLQRGPLDDQQAGYVEQLLRGCTRAADLTRQLLAFARKGDYQRRSVEVHALLDEVIAILQRTIAPSITIERAFEAARTHVLADASQLQSALLNLALNARDAMPDGGTLRIASRVVSLDRPAAQGLVCEPGPYLHLAISDTGQGIEPAIRERIFEPFFTTKPAGQGTGMGLAATHGTVRACGGDIALRSELGHGTCFGLYLPLDPEDAATTPTLVNAPGHCHRPAQVLLIDDEPVLGELGAALLAEAGHHSTVFTDPQAALACCRERGPGAFDIVIIDMIMPVLNGRQTLRALRSIDAEVPVLIASGYSLEQDIDELRTLGIAGYLSKPFAMADLHEAVARFRRPSAVGLEADFFSESGGDDQML